MIIKITIKGSLLTCTFFSNSAEIKIVAGYDKRNNSKINFPDFSEKSNLFEIEFLAEVSNIKFLETNTRRIKKIRLIPIMVHLFSRNGDLIVKEKFSIGL